MRNKVPKVPAKYRSIDVGVIMKRFLGCCFYRIKKKSASVTLFTRAVYFIQARANRELYVNI